MSLPPIFQRNSLHKVFPSFSNNYPSVVVREALPCSTPLNQNSLDFGHFGNISHLEVTWLLLHILSVLGVLTPHYRHFLIQYHSKEGDSIT